MSRLSGSETDLTGEPPFRDMVEAAPTAMILVDRAGRIVLINAEAERMFGYPRFVLRGQPVELLVPASARPQHAALRGAFEREPRKRAMGASRDLTGVRADGSELPIEVGLTPIDTPDGPCVLAVVTDVSERARAERTRAHLAAIVLSSDDAIVSKTLDGIVTSWNRAAELILGWSEAEIVGQPVALIIPPDRRDEEARILARVRNGGSVEDLATVRLRRDGKLVPVSITVSPIRDLRGRVVGASKILRDATERRRGERAMLQANAALELAVAERTRELATQQEALRRAEAALAQSQKLEAVGQLTGGVAHDFNNLLTVIEGNLHLIDRQVGANAPLARAIAGIGRAVERGARLTGSLLAFARQQTLQPEVARLDDIVQEFSLLAMRAVGEKVRLSIDAPADLWRCLIDRAQFE
jgi:PAS domain S-box-containing protein